MFLYLAHLLIKHFSALRLFDYVSFRAISACFVSLVFSILIGKPVINWLVRLKIGQSVRSDGPQTHLIKAGTPTMGGVLIIISTMTSSLLFVDLDNRFIWVVFFVFIATGLIGFIDDYRKIVYKDSRGLPGKLKIVFQSIITIVAVACLINWSHLDNTELMVIPFLKSISHPFGVLGFLVLSYVVVVGSSNSVNLTDGLDGLVSFPIITVSLGLAIFCYIASNKFFSSYLLLPYIPGSEELVVFLSALIGASLGFLWFNAYPAQVFMGDVGSLAIGAVLGLIAIIVRQEIIFAVMGGVFVIEALSVILQVGSYKLRKKRIFAMAPIHHHFELKGVKETKVVVRFWIVSIILLLIGLCSIKVR